MSIETTRSWSAVGVCTTLTSSESLRRAAALSVVITDNDGTLTDGTVLYTEAGELAKRYSLRDGHGVELLREVGVVTAIATREASAIARRRADKLGIEHVWTGVRDKVAELPAFLEALGTSVERVAYIGDDLNDLPIIGAIGERGGLTAAPADAHPAVREAAHCLAVRPGGHGAFRDFAEWIVQWRRRAADLCPPTTTGR